MFRVLSGLLILSLGFGLAPAIRAAPPDEKTRGPAKVTGTLVFREKLEFLPGTRVEVTLREEDAESAPLRPLGKVVLRDVKTTPIPFIVEYNPADVKKGARYFLHARVFTRRSTLHTSSPDIQVFTDKNPGTDVLVNMAPVRGRIEPDR
jgi:uncharacterized lipoprotein YbaY